MNTLEILQKLDDDEIRFFREYKGDFVKFREYLHKKFGGIFAEETGGFELNKHITIDGNMVYILNIKGRYSVSYHSSDVILCYLKASQIYKEWWDDATKKACKELWDELGL